MPGFERNELSVRLTASPGGEPAEALRRAAAETGMAREGGPEVTVVSGGRGEVLGALAGIVEAALDAGARTVEATVESEGDAPRFGEG